ncbi:unnamed protein product [Symbiodinium necroappetens]|uniref:Reverse transcriptase domain-containing protein n=1 Tax=Symbiodinium necroappetens TaxID=1628268 RepID=A0A812NLP1_9DINO|nr:unnamed protein product [Symbiodinium necroappetens]
MEDAVGSPKREAGWQEGGPPTKKLDTATSSNPPPLGVDIAQMQQLLEQHSTRILQAQKENLEGMMALFESRTDDRFKHVEARATSTEERVSLLENKIEKMHDQLANALQGRGVGRGGEPERRFTLVFGGWGRDTRRQTILQQLEEALDQLNLKQHLDASPFCTGPRRSTALANFSVREHEGDHDVRKRMHTIIVGLANSQVAIPQGRSMFATFSKTKGERAIAAHAGWVKRAISKLGQDILSTLDVEYSTGTCWMGDRQATTRDREDDGGQPRKSVHTKVELMKELCHKPSGILEWQKMTTRFTSCKKSPDMRHVTFGNEAWVGSAHFDPACTQIVHRAAADEKDDLSLPSSRVWTSGPQLIDGIDQGVLKKLARECTKPKPGKAYKDPTAVKQAVKTARVSRTAAAWKEVHKLRKHARKVWENQRIQEAMQGDWEQVRKLRMVKNTGWDIHFAEKQGEGDPHQCIHEHLESIYTTGNQLPELPTWDGEVQAFTEDELKTAIAAGHRNKAVGTDMTSHELLQGIMDTPGGCTHLLEFYNHILCTADIPADWNRAIMVVIPKTSFPSEPGDLRPLSMGSAAAKVFAHMLLTRSAPQIQLKGPEQCCGKGRQTCDFIFVVSRLMQLEHEWKQGTCWLKVDLAKAFDKVDRRVLVNRLEQRMGMCAEFRCWYNLLRGTDAVLQTGWDTSIIAMHDGIKQGAIESPAFFGFLAETCLHEASVRYKWHEQANTFPGLELNNLLYMDDGLQWSNGVVDGR